MENRWSFIDIFKEHDSQNVQILKHLDLCAHLGTRKFILSN